MPPLKKNMLCAEQQKEGEKPRNVDATRSTTDKCKMEQMYRTWGWFCVGRMTHWMPWQLNLRSLLAPRSRGPFLDCHWQTSVHTLSERLALLPPLAYTLSSSHPPGRQILATLFPISHQTPAHQVNSQMSALQLAGTNSCKGFPIHYLPVLEAT